MKRLLLPLLAALALPNSVNAEWQIREDGRFKTKFLGCYGDICQTQFERINPKPGWEFKGTEIFDCKNLRTRFARNPDPREPKPEWSDVIIGTVGFREFKDICSKNK